MDELVDALSEWLSTVDDDSSLRFQLASLLLGPEASMDVRDESGATALHLAARLSSDEAAEVLLRHGWDVNARDRQRRTPLHVAISREPPATAVIRALLRAGASLYAEDAEAATPLERAVALPGEAGVDVTTLLLDSAGSGAAALMHDTRALNFAAYFGNEAVVALLLERGADRRLRTTMHRAPLHMVAYKGHAHLVRMLVQAGAEVDATDIHGVTPLHVAVSQNHTLTACALVAYGADMYAPRGPLRPPLWLAKAVNYSTFRNLVAVVALGSDKETFKRHAEAAPALGYLEPLRLLEVQLLEAVGPIAGLADEYDDDPPLQRHEMFVALVVVLLGLLVLQRLLRLGVRKLRRTRAAPRRTVPQRLRVQRAARGPAVKLRDLKEKQEPRPAAAALLCTVCMDAPLEGTFLPCGHMAACMDCGEQVMQGSHKLCPICRVACDRFLRIFIHGA